MGLNTQTLNDVAERAVSTGWQVAAGAAIAENVFHDPSLTPLCAAGLAVAKAFAVWFYTRNKAEIDKDLNTIGTAVVKVKPVIEAAAQTSAPRPPAATSPAAPPAP